MFMAIQMKKELYCPKLCLNTLTENGNEELVFLDIILKGNN